MAYIGCILFALIFVVMTAQGNGSFGARMSSTFAWLHDWAPFSYLLILILVLAPVISLKIMNSWPKHVEPEDPMRKYRHPEDVVDD